MNKTQIQTLIAPFVGILTAWLARKIPFIDAATWATVIDTIVAIATSAFIAWRTGGVQLADTVSKLTPDTKVITSPEIANALPANPDVVASTEAKVVPK